MNCVVNIGGATLQTRNASIRRSESGLSLRVTINAFDSELVATLLESYGFAIDIEADGASIASGLIESVRYDLGSSNASISILATGDHEPGNTTRQLYGVSYQRQSESGRAVRCAVDPLLRVGDTAEWAGNTISVSSIVATISADSSVMEIS